MASFLTRQCVVFVISLTVFSGCSAKERSVQDVVSIHLSMHLPNTAKVVATRDSFRKPELPIPGGWTDGDSGVVFEFSEEEHQAVLKHIELSLAIGRHDGWKRMPLPNEFVTGLSRSVLLVGGEPKMPLDNQHGYYLFIDRWTNKSEELMALRWDKRPSFDITLAIYDEKLRRLYFVMVDT
jgi:hypothetical protein